MIVNLQKEYMSITILQKYVKIHDSQITKRNAESILTALGFKIGELNYIDNIGKDMVLEVIYDGEKVLPGQKIPLSSELDLILGNGKKQYQRKI